MTQDAVKSNGRPERFSHIRAVEDLPHSCRCGARWSGSNTAHCGAFDCHLTFTGEWTFRRHRQNGACVHPSDAGLVVVPGRAYECWGTIAVANAARGFRSA